ncbi:hypothetical protein EVG20_g179 [Dentipellis fragilis]|uniref:Dystroglycan-type cadherin-like domain-containing protein n=1 Tax=Dentipellis fragilis TaxID=205917 RepID=A0A4Y9ZE25_9AGAM|nr:hypothetical protein EVG20_g179 [Dentipellis fragilis]
MLLVLQLALFVTLTFGPQAVLSKFDSILFSSIEQCGSFNVTFSQGKLPPALPLSLTVVPFNATPFSIPIPSSSWNDSTGTGALITFLPLAAGSTFVASLDDANGNSTGRVSDVIGIQASGNTSCLPTGGAQPAAPFIVTSTVSQCEPFTVTFNNSADSQPPSVRAFVPKGPAFHVQPTPSSGVPGEANYLMNIPRGLEVALLIQDASGNKADSGLITVQGDSSSSTQCFPQPSPSPKPSSPSGKLSKGSIIAIGVVSGAVVGALIISVAFYAMHERRRRRALLGQTPSNVEAKLDRYDSPTTPPAPPPKSPRSLAMYDKDTTGPRYLANPPYPNESYNSSPDNNYLSESRERGGTTVGTSRSLDLPRTPNSAIPNNMRSMDPSDRSLASLDIAGILDAVTDEPNAPHSPASQSPLPTPLLSARSVFKTAEGLDVPQSARLFGRFSGLTMELDPERERADGVESRMSIGVVTPGQADIVPGNPEDYLSEQGSIRSRPFGAGARGRTRSGDSTVRSMLGR